MAHNNHTRNTNNSGIRFYKQIYNEQEEMRHQIHLEIEKMVFG